MWVTICTIISYLSGILLRLYFDPNLSKCTFPIIYGIIYLYTNIKSNGVTRVILAKFIAYGVQCDAFAALSMLFLMRARIQSKINHTNGHFNVISGTLIKRIGTRPIHGLANYAPNTLLVWWIFANLSIGPCGLPVLIIPIVNLFRKNGCECDDDFVDYNAHTTKSRQNASNTLQRILVRKLGRIVGHH